MTKAMLRATLLAGTCLAVLGTCAQNMVVGEYWVDADPGWGQATPIAITTPQSQVSGLQFPVLTNSLAPGIHLIGIRTKDANHRWSLTNVTPVYINAAPRTSDIVRTVYFWNADGGWNSGTDSDMDGSANVSGPATASLDGTTPGINTLFMRSLDADGHWSLTNAVPVYVEAVRSGEIVAAESFWDMDPGFGQGDPVPDWTSGVNVLSDFGVTVPVGIDVGFHKLYIRTKDSHGHWSLTNWQQSTIDIGDVVGDALAEGFGISTYPNPFTEGITVRMSDGLPVRVILYDPQGKLVHDKVLSGESYIDLSGHASGSYTAFFWNKAERIHRVALIKE